MGKTVSLIIFFIWLPQAIRQILAWLYWWQTKEYRWDRFKIFLFSPQGKKELSLNLIALKLLLLSFSFLNSRLLWLSLLPFLILDGKFLGKFLKHQLRRPVFTPRATGILAISLAFTALIGAGFYRQNHLPFLLGLGEISLLLAPSLGILATAPIVAQIKRKEIKKAKSKLKKIEPVVIGVTGSYGKTTTKEFIAHLLSQKYPTVKTAGSENTDLGIARKIIRHLKKESRFLVAEMGAYKKGEVKALAQIINPQVGVVTGIEPQHLALFGSLEKIKKTKFELIAALPPAGMAIFNFADRNCRQLAQEAKKRRPRVKVLGYKAKIAAVNPKGVTFEVKENKVSKRFFAPLKGAHLAENLAGAILVARAFGLSWAQISQGCRTVKLPEKTMKTYQLKTGARIIDDSFNATPKGFAAAINYLALFKKQKKTVITPGIIELGQKTKQIHRKLGRLMGQKIDRIIITQQGEWVREIKKGLGKKSARLAVIDNPEKLAKKLAKMIKAGEVVLLEGRMPKNLEVVIRKNA